MIIPGHLFKVTQYLEWHQKENFWFFLQFSGINTYNLVKNDPKFGNKGLFQANFMDLNMKNLLDSKAMIFGIWGLKTSLRQSGPKRCIKQ